MSHRHSNISVFVPHIGCPHKCSFCNQRYITGVFSAPDSNDVENIVKIAASGENYNPNNTEIAFFGGNFTAINRNYMLNLLQTASKFVEDGTVSGIRISTRPDAIDGEILALLKKYNVTSIELGAQSLDDNVLKMNNRGHSAEDVVKASALIKEFGFELGLQMMTGLYGDNESLAVKTAKKIIEINPKTVRIYPTIVLKDTDIAALYAKNIYCPQSLDEAVDLAAKLYLMFTNVGITVIRLGLHSIEGEAYISGPWHPAFSELCQSKILFDKALNGLSEKGNYTIFVSKSDLSKMIGQRKKNLIQLGNMGYNCSVKADESLNNLELIIKREV